MRVKITKTSPIPVRGSREAAGYDLEAAEDVTIEPGEGKRIHTGIRIQMPPGWYGAVKARSSTFMRGLIVNGTIDSDYRGEIMVQVWNIGNESQTIRKGNRIAQIIFQMHGTADFDSVADLDISERGQGGFGSTGL